MADAFHEATVTQEAVGIVVNNIKARTVKFGREHFFSQSHTHRVTDTLSQRTRSGFHAGRHIHFRMSGRLAVPLAEGL